MNSEFISRLQVSDSGFAFDPKTGSTFSLNHTGVMLVQRLRDGKSRDEIVSELSKEYGVEPEDALRDVEDFIIYIKGLDEN